MSRSADLLARSRRALDRLELRSLHALAARRGYDVALRNFYSPLVDPATLPAQAPRSAFAGIGFDADRQLAYLRDALGPFLTELELPGHAPDDVLHLRNRYYSAGDAETLYATVRARRPARVLELGSGYSSLIIDRALTANGAGEHVIYDPYARPAIAARATRVVRRSATDVPAEEIAALAAGDVLFVDTSHVVKAGSEVNHIVLDVLPALAAGVAVHFHDVFLPWDYPREYVTELGVHWSEQYLLQAFLALNPDYAVLLAVHALSRIHSAPFAELIPSVRGGAAPAAFWIERIAPPAAAG